MGAGRAAKLEEKTAPGIHGDAGFAYQQGVRREFQGPGIGEVVKRGKPQGGQPLVMKRHHQGNPAVDAVGIGVALHIAQGVGRN